MTKEKSEHTLLKLRSGEEIIGRRVSAKRGYTGLERPLQINKSSIIDPHSGEIRKNICVLRNWMEFAVETRCEIPNDSILVTSTPTPEVVQRYKHELDRQDINAEVLKSLPDSELNKIMGDISKVEKPPIDPRFTPLTGQGDWTTKHPFQLPPTSPQDQILNDMLNKIIGPRTPTPAPGQGAITITMSIPPDVFMNILFNLPMFDGVWGEEFPEDEEGDEDDDEGDQPKPQPPPKGQTPKRKPKKDKDDDPPSNGWHGRFGFPK